MKIKCIIVILLCVSLFSGCAIAKKRKRKPGKGELPITQKVDLDVNNVKETIKVEEDKAGSGPAFVLTVMRPDRNKTYTVRFNGSFINMELIGLNLEEVDNKQIAVAYRDKDDAENLVIYRLSNDRLTKMYSTRSICGIDTDFQTPLARVMIDQPICENDVCTCANQPNWETWIWTGDRFIKELR